MSRQLDLSPEVLDLLERHLDGLLSPDEERRFQAIADADPLVRHHLELQARLDATLRNGLAPCAPQPLSLAQHTAATGAPESASLTPKPRPKPRFSWMRVAALIAITLSGYFAYFYITSLPQPTAPRPFITPALAYQNEVSAGMRPYEVCTTPEAFATYTKDRLGTALNVQPLPGLTLIGWNYGQRVFSDQTVSLLATYEGKPVVILMDKAKCGRPTSAPTELAESSRVVGGVLLHELRPQGTPSVLDQFSAQ